jgi:hypothetical protein
MTEHAHAPPNPHAELWDHVKYLVQWFGALFGDPIQLAQTILLTRNERDAMAQWLRMIETLLRRVLLIEAAALPKPAFQARAPHPRRQRRRRMIEHDAETPEAWRVSFHLIARAPRAALSRRTAAQAAPISAWPLAERLEAVLRVLENPAPHIARAARRLHRRPDAARRIAKPVKLKQRWAESCLEDSEPLAQTAVPVFCNSS